MMGEPLAMDRATTAKRISQHNSYSDSDGDLLGVPLLPAFDPNSNPPP